MNQRVFNAVMWTITTAAAAVILGGLIAALWDAITWGTYGRAAITALIAWFLLAIPTAALLKPQRKKVHSQGQAAPFSDAGLHLTATERAQQSAGRSYVETTLGQSRKEDKP